MEVTGARRHDPAAGALALSSLFDFHRATADLIHQRMSERGAGMCVRRFGGGQLICRKGEYELDLCFILRGRVDLYDVAADGSRVKAASIPRGAFR